MAGARWIRSRQAFIHQSVPLPFEAEERVHIGAVSIIDNDRDSPVALAMLVVSSANLLLLDEPTNNLDPASREEILDALVHYAGGVVLVSHDPGAIEALNPERVLILPDGVEDIWNEEYADLVELA